MRFLATDEEKISIHSSHTGRDASIKGKPKTTEISIHSSHTGRDGTAAACTGWPSNFNPLFPYGKRQERRRRDGRTGNFNPLFPYGKRQIFPAPYKVQSNISIHSSHTGRDHARTLPETNPRNFNPLFPYGKRPCSFVMAVNHFSISIHSSHTGRDLLITVVVRPCHAFQSTLPIREETIVDYLGLMAPDNFNPLFPYGKRLWREANQMNNERFQSTLPIREETRRNRRGGRPAEISIHSSHTGRDRQSQRLRARAEQFQSTLPIREETCRDGREQPVRRNFNPLFPYGKRLPGALAGAMRTYFNPLFPYGKRQRCRRFHRRIRPISIHSSHTGRDASALFFCLFFCDISIHSSHTGRDRPAEKVCCQNHPYFNPLFPYGKRPDAARIQAPRRYFNPLFPYGKRPGAPALGMPEQPISIHSSHTGRDFSASFREPMVKFQSTLPIREETQALFPSFSGSSFQSTLPIREETFSSRGRVRDW